MRDDITITNSEQWFGLTDLRTEDFLKALKTRGWERNEDLTKSFTGGYELFFERKSKYMDKHFPNAGYTDQLCVIGGSYGGPNTVIHSEYLSAAQFLFEDKE